MFHLYLIVKGGACDSFLAIAEEIPLYWKDNIVQYLCLGKWGLQGIFLILEEAVESTW